MQIETESRQPPAEFSGPEAQRETRFGETFSKITVRFRRFLRPTEWESNHAAMAFLPKSRREFAKPTRVGRFRTKLSMHMLFQAALAGTI